MKDADVQWFSKEIKRMVANYSNPFFAVTSKDTIDKTLETLTQNERVFKTKTKPKYARYGNVTFIPYEHMGEECFFFNSEKDAKEFMTAIDENIEVGVDPKALIGAMREYTRKRLENKR